MSAGMKQVEKQNSTGCTGGKGLAESAWLRCLAAKTATHDQSSKGRLADPPTSLVQGMKFHRSMHAHHRYCGPTGQARGPPRLAGPPRSSQPRPASSCLEVTEGRGRQGPGCSLQRSMHCAALLLGGMAIVPDANEPAEHPSFVHPSPAHHWNDSLPTPTVAKPAAQRVEQGDAGRADSLQERPERHGPAPVLSGQCGGLRGWEGSRS